MINLETTMSIDVPVRAFVFNMETGLLSEVEALPQKTAA